MRSQLAERLGVETPQIVHRPPDVASLDAAQEAIELADAYLICDGHPLDESQKFTLRVGLGERSDGSWAAPTVGDFEPRQNGKNDTCNARELAGLVLFGERLLIHTAHEFPTSNESFLRLVSIFENWDDLRRLVARIRYANGEQGIEFLSGQRLKYRARTGGSGRGFAKADLIVYDEAQHLQAEHVAASGPAKLANPNNQSWYMGSGGLATSVNAWRMRRRALSGDGGRFAYVEHTAEQVTLVGGQVVSVKPDVLDRDAWALANAAYGRRITDESMYSLYEELGPELFARECLCMWDPEPGAGGGVIPLSTWHGCCEETSTVAGMTAFAFDVTPDRNWSSIAVAGNSAKSTKIHVEIVDHRRGTDWVVPRLLELRDCWSPGAIACDDGGPAGGLLTQARAAGLEITTVSAREHAQACGGLLDSIRDGDVVHIGQAELNDAVAGSDRRDMGDAWLWARKKTTVDISPLVAITLAKWAWESSDLAVATASCW